MKTLFIDAKYSGEVKLTNTTLNYLKKFKTIAIYSSVQFSSNLKTIISQLKDHKIITSQPKRTSSPFQILGCNVKKEDLNLKEKPDAFLYIGDGLFHPLALLFSRDKKVIQYNPLIKKHKILTQKNIEKILKKQKVNFTKFLHSNTVGVIISLKSGQERFKEAKNLIKKYPEKQFYFFLDNDIDLNSLENFPFIETWVNTACPRIALDDSLNTSSVIINLDSLE